MRQPEEAFPSEISEARRRFAEWRQAGRRGRRIPEKLWRIAAELARRQGANRTGLQLGLNPTVLKQRLAALAKATSKVVGEAAKPVRFVEFAIAEPVHGGGWVIEVEDGRGAKLRVEAPRGTRPDLAALTRAFLREPR